MVIATIRRCPGTDRFGAFWLVCACTFPSEGKGSVKEEKIIFFLFYPVCISSFRWCWQIWTQVWEAAVGKGDLSEQQLACSSGLTHHRAICVL